MESHRPQIRLVKEVESGLYRYECLNQCSQTVLGGVPAFSVFTPFYSAFDPKTHWTALDDGEGQPVLVDKFTLDLMRGRYVTFLSDTEYRSYPGCEIDAKPTDWSGTFARVSSEASTALKEFETRTGLTLSEIEQITQYHTGIVGGKVNMVTCTACETQFDRGTWMVCKSCGIRHTEEGHSEEVCKDGVAGCQVCGSVFLDTVTGRCPRHPQTIA